MKATLHIDNQNIRLNNAFVSITDMAKIKGKSSTLIPRWISLKHTIEFLGAWEILSNNEAFNHEEFEVFKNAAGSNAFELYAGDWIEKTGAIGIKVMRGRYGGTYAHREIALDFARWLSPVFQAHFYKEYFNLLEEKYGEQAIDHQVKRRLAAINHHLHTDAIKANLLLRIRKADQKYVYASEVDMLNMAVFGMTAKQYNATKGDIPGNLRDSATKEQLWTLMNLQVLNAEYMQQSYAPDVRVAMIQEKAEELMIQAERYGVERLLKKKN